MSGISLPPIGKGPSGAVGGPRSPSGPGGPPGAAKAPRTGPGPASAASGARPSTALLAALWGFLAFGIATVAWGVWSWSADRFDVRLQVAAALVSFFASVVVLARLRVDLNRRRSSGSLVERPLTSSRTTTAVALVSWSCGIAHVSLVALELSAGGGA